MKLRKAIKQANKQKRGITRNSWEPEPMWIIPTNTLLCMIVMHDEKQMSTRWNPNADDLTADDWIVYG